MNNINQYQELANKFADLIEKNEAPWQKSWSGNGFLPYNIKTGKEYNGINLLNLMCAAADKGYEDTRWLTFLQAGEQNAKVRAGEKGIRIMYLQTTETKKEVDEITGEEIVIKEKLEKPRAMWSVVFNAEQCEGLPKLELKQIDFNPIEKAQEILDNSGAKIKHKAQGKAYYSPITDEITLPLQEQFNSPEEYYRTALHELGHWTGHQNRNNRDLTGGFGSESYAKEELIAEITSFLVGTQCGLGHEPNDNNVAYIKNWSKEIRNDPSFLFNAVKEADKAAKLILGKELELNKVKENEQEMDKKIKDTLEKADLNYSSRTYLDVKDEMEFGMYEDYLYENNKSLSDYGVLYDEAHKALYIDDMEKWQNNAENDEKIKTLLTPAQVPPLDRYYLTLDDYMVDHMPEKNHQAVAEKLGLTYDNDTHSFYCKPDEREKYMPWLHEFNNISDDNKLYLNISDEDGKKLIPYNIHYDNQKYYIHKDLSDVFSKIAEENGIKNFLGRDNTPEKSMNREMPVTYIKVPIEEKEQAKELGAKWDANYVCWFVPAGKDTALFEKWEKVDEKDLIAKKQQQQNKNEPTNKQENKYILAVPYDEREDAKKLGAMWDDKGKCWYCNEAYKEKFFKWDIKNVENKVQSAIPVSIEEEFLNHIKKCGVLENNVIADGQKHRISVDGDKGKEQSGFYVLHSDGVANGYFMNNRTGEEIKWVSKEHSLSPEEKSEMKAVFLAKKAEREENDRILTEKAEKALYAKFMNKETIHNHTYLSNKMIEPTKNIYAGNDNTITVPLFDVNGRLKSAQYINEDGEKRFAKNTNKVGAFHIVDGVPNDLKSAKSIIIAEGYATAVSVNEAVKEPGMKVIAAMSASNIEHTVKAINDKFPGKNIIITADNDLNNKIGNIGLNAANNVAEKNSNVKVVVPKINGKEIAGDFNDVISKNGLSKEDALKNIRKSIAPALKLDKQQEQTKTNERGLSKFL